LQELRAGHSFSQIEREKPTSWSNIILNYRELMAGAHPFWAAGIL
jgi:hypothetical protein